MTNQNNQRFKPFVEATLKKAEWFPDRNVSQTVSKWQNELYNSDGWDLFFVAKKVLLEFGGLKINQKGEGQTLAREPFEINPILAIYERDRFSEYESVLGTRLYPLGEAASGHYFLAIGENEHIFYLMDDILLAGENIDEALNNLIIGIKPEAI